MNKTEQMTITHASLFSGIGGFDLAADIMGWENRFWCEINPFCQTILKYHFPYAKEYSDIRNADFSTWRGQIDVLSGGFPCQPFSLAGKRRGTSDERHLWPEMLGAIRQIRPRWVVGENVYGIVNWNDGLVFKQVCIDLESEGFEVQPVVLPACGVNAPHQRSRTFFVAYADNARLQRCENQRGLGESRQEIFQQSGRLFCSDRQIISTQPLICGNDDEFSQWLDSETVFEGEKPSRRANAFSHWRTESIKAYGNAVVPPLVVQIFKTIDLFEKLYGVKK